MSAGLPVVLSLGSNLGDRLATLVGGLRALREVDGLELDRVSSVYETAPWGGVPQDDFYNVVATGTTTLTPEELLATCLAVEDDFGRTRDVRWGPRTLDVDVIALGEERAQTEALHLPHPRAQERAFVIVPWLELEPAGVLPGWGSLAEIAGRLPVDDVTLLPAETGRLEEALA